MLRKYARNLLVALDQFVNAVLGGDPDETISSRAAKRPDVWYWAALGWVIERISPGHLARSVENDEGADGLDPPAKR